VNAQQLCNPVAIWWHHQVQLWVTYKEIETSHGIFANKKVIAKEYKHPIRDVLTEANLVTASGFVALLYATNLMYVGGSNLWLVPWLLTWGAGFSDALDGAVAQWTGRYSRFGRVLDPLRDRYTIVLLAATVYRSELLRASWMLPLIAVIVVEVRIASLNRQIDTGSHAWSKRRYLIHLVVISQYICQTCWVAWPHVLSATAVGWLLLAGSLVAYVDVRRRAKALGIRVLL